MELMTVTNMIVQLCHVANLPTTLLTRDAICGDSDLHECRIYVGDVPKHGNARCRWRCHSEGYYASSWRCLTQRQLKTMEKKLATALSHCTDCFPHFHGQDREQCKACWKALRALHQRSSSLERPESVM